MGLIVLLGSRLMGARKCKRRNWLGTGIKVMIRCGSTNGGLENFP